MFATKIAANRAIQSDPSVSHAIFISLAVDSTASCNQLVIVLSGLSRMELTFSEWRWDIDS